MTGFIKISQATVRLAAVALVAAGGVVVAQAASAQTAPTNPLTDFQNQDTRDPFSNRGGNQVGGVMDLIHRAMQAGSLSSEEFSSEQKENLDSAAAQFRALQEQRLKGAAQQPAGPQVPVTITPAPATTSPTAN